MATSRGSARNKPGPVRVDRVSFDIEIDGLTRGMGGHIIDSVGGRLKIEWAPDEGFVRVTETADKERVWIVPFHHVEWMRV